MTDNSPALIRLADVCQVEGGGSVGRIRRHAGNPPLVALPAVCGIALVPDVDRYVLSLMQTLQKLGKGVLNGKKRASCAHKFI